MFSLDSTSAFYLPSFTPILQDRTGSFSLFSTNSDMRKYFKQAFITSTHLHKTHIFWISGRKIYILRRQPSTKETSFKANACIDWNTFLRMSNSETYHTLGSFPMPIWFLSYFTPEPYNSRRKKWYIIYIILQMVDQ